MFNPLALQVRYGAAVLPVWLYHSHMRLFSVLFLSLFVLHAPVRAAVDLPDLGDPSRVGFSEEVEARLGQEIMRQIRGSRDYYNDTVLTDYLNRLGERLVAASDEPGRRFEFFVVRDPSINAFALPGGYIGVHTGLLSAARSEAELAGVLAHEIAHVTQHHIARFVKDSEGLSMAALAGIAVAILAARSNPQLADAALRTSQAYGLQQQIDFTRAHEHEADRVGYQILEGAGFDPAGMVSFFERLMLQGRSYDNNAPVYLRTHPLSHDRMADMQNRIAQRPYHPLRESPEPGVAFELLRAQIQAHEGDVVEAVRRFRAQVNERPQDPAARYGLIEVLLRDNDARSALTHVEVLRKRLALPLVEMQAARVIRAAKGPEAALPGLQAALARWPGDRALGYLTVRTYLAAGQARMAHSVVVERQRTWPEDIILWRLLAETELALGHSLESHLAEAEAYAREGLLQAAIDQLQTALREARQGGIAGKGNDFYALSIAESRLGTLREALQRQNADGRGRREKHP